MTRWSRWITNGGYQVQTVSSVDRGRLYRVTHPQGFEVPLNPWDPQHSPPIRTLEQLIEVLKREGEDFATLIEVESG